MTPLDHIIELQMETTSLILCVYYIHCLSGKQWIGMLE